MKSDYKNEILTIYLGERVDTSNAESVETEINEIRAKFPDGSIVVDCDATEYVSSAGLRVILRLGKKEPTLKIINVKPDVYEIFDMTGFTEILSIAKAYKNISIDGCEVIGQGACGKVYRLTQDTIVKVYSNNSSMEDILRERSLAKKAFVMGVPTAISYDIVKVGEYYGTVFELLNAKSFAKELATNPDNMDYYVKLYTDILKKTHSIETDDTEIPNVKPDILFRAEGVRSHLPKETGDKLVKLVENIPDSKHLIHGDYHIKNVMFQDGDVLIIDMDTLGVGNPVLEFGSMFNAYLGHSEVDHSAVERFLGITYDVAEKFWHKTLVEYFGADDEKVKEAEKKARLLGYFRLLYRNVHRNLNNTEQGAKEYEAYRNKVIELVAEIDDLAL